MTRKTVDVEVFDGDETIDVAHDRPVRLMPSGKAAIVYRERVYPLYEGNIIHLEDLPLDMELCQRFVAWDEPVPYCSYREEEWDSADDETHEENLGIGSWYLESSKLGHYLAFDASEAGAQRLAAAIEESDLGLVKLGESFRPAADGHQYDWYIRLRFRGQREHCLRVLEGILGSTKSLDMNEFEPQRDSPGNQSVSHWEIVTQALTLLADPEQRQEVRQILDSFGEGYGYLSWRYSQVSSHARSSPAAGVETLGRIVAEDKNLIDRLEKEYGDFLDDDNRHLAQRAIDAEFELIDLEDSWNTGDGALRRSRASTRFLRKAVVLTMANEDYADRLRPMLHQLKPPATVQFNRALPNHVKIAVETLRETISQVEALFAGDFLGELYMFSQVELQGIQSGELDFLVSPAPSRTEDDRSTSDLPFAILPPGEKITQFIGDIRSSGQYRGGEVDLGRLDVIEAIWEYHEGKNCSLYRGVFPSSGKDNGYVVLSFVDEQCGPCAIAISPWKGEHATFLLRGDSGQRLPWETVFSKTKDEAKRLGARKLLFTPNHQHGLDEYVAMQEKIMTLLVCSPRAFERGELYFDEEYGCYIAREPWPEDDDDRQEPPRGDSSPGFFKRIMNWIERNVEFE